MSPPTAEQLLRREELAELLKVSTKTIDRLRHRERDPLPALRVAGRIVFSPSAVQQWLSRQSER